MKRSALMDRKAAKGSCSTSSPGLPASTRWCRAARRLAHRRPAQQPTGCPGSASWRGRARLADAFEIAGRAFLADRCWHVLVLACPPREARSQAATCRRSSPPRERSTGQIFLLDPGVVVPATVVAVVARSVEVGVLAAASAIFGVCGRRVPDRCSRRGATRPNDRPGPRMRLEPGRVHVPKTWARRG